MKRQPEIILKIVDRVGADALPEIQRLKRSPPASHLSTHPLRKTQALLLRWLSSGELARWHSLHRLPLPSDGLEHRIDLILSRVRANAIFLLLILDYERFRRVLRYGLNGRLAKVDAALQKLSAATGDLCPRGFPHQARLMVEPQIGDAVEDEVRNLLRLVSEIQSSQLRIKSLLDHHEERIQTNSQSNEFIAYMVDTFYLTGARPGKSNRGPFVEFVTAAWEDLEWDVPPKNADDVEGWLGEQINKHPVVKAAVPVTRQRVEAALQLSEDLWINIQHAETGPR